MRPRQISFTAGTLLGGTANRVAIFDSTNTMTTDANLAYDASTDELKIGTPGFVSLYNTADQTTNYERLELAWASNVAVIRMQNGGSGTDRTLALRYADDANAITIPAAATGAIAIASGSSGATAVNGRVQLAENTVTATSGFHTCVSSNPSFSPSSSSTMTARVISLSPAINYAGGGAGRVTVIRIASTNTALPTGQNGAIVLASTAAQSTGLNGIHLYNTADEATNYERLGFSFASDIALIDSIAAGTGTRRGLQILTSGGSLGFYGATPVAQQTGVAVTAAGIHAALVSLGLITA